MRAATFSLVRAAGACWTEQGVSADGGAFRVISGHDGDLWLALVTGSLSGWDTGAIAVSRPILDALEANALARDRPRERRWAEAFGVAQVALDVLAPPRAEGEFDLPCCTALCACLRGALAHVAWVGSEVALLVRSGKVARTTLPHTIGRDMVERGVVAPDELHRWPHAYIPTRVLVAGRPARPESLVAPWALLPGDRLVLASGRVARAYDADELGRVASFGPPEHAARALVEGAVAREPDRGHGACAVVAALGSPHPYR